MGIELGSSRTATPSVKLRNIGDKVIVAVVDVTAVPWLEYGTNEQKVGKDGKARSQDKVTALVVAGNGVITDNETDREVVPGEIVSIYLAGHNRWEFIEAKRKLTRPLNVGDVMQWRYDRDEKSSVASNPKKVRTVAIRPPKAEEGEQTRRCEQLHHQLRNEGIALDQSNSVDVDDIDPF
jgi:hypothetical protein